MSKVSLAFVRVMFFVMLFVSSACGKMERSLAGPETAAPSAPASQAALETRVRDLDARVASLQARLDAVNAAEVQSPEVSGVRYWD